MSKWFIKLTGEGKQYHVRTPHGGYLAHHGAPLIHTSFDGPTALVTPLNAGEYWDSAETDYSVDPIIADVRSEDGVFSTLVNLRPSLDQLPDHLIEIGTDTSSDWKHTLTAMVGMMVINKHPGLTHLFDYLEKASRDDVFMDFKVEVDQQNLSDYIEARMTSEAPSI
jgi:hypothetical protein